MKQYRDTALHYAAFHGYLEIVCMLLEHGACLDAQNEVSFHSYLVFIY